MNKSVRNIGVGATCGRPLFFCVLAAAVFLAPVFWGCGKKQLKGADSPHSGETAAQNIQTELPPALTPYEIVEFGSHIPPGLPFNDEEFFHFSGFVGAFAPEEKSQWSFGQYKEEFTASSTLAPQEDYSYDAENLQNRQDVAGGTRSEAWCEGVKGYGIGERVNMRVKILAEYEYAINFRSLMIVSGDAKDETAWKDNSRVKILRLYVGGKHWCDLHLEDVIKPQIFRFPERLRIYPKDSGKRISAEENFESRSVYGNEKGRQLDLSFEIIEVYPGDKYDNTCITGIALDIYGGIHTSEKAADGFTYTLINNGQAYRITGYAGTAQNLTIPGAYKGWPVTEFRLNDCGNVTGAAISDGITKIENWAFSACTGLVRVTIPKSVKRIENFAFLNCGNLESITVDKANTVYRSEKNNVIQISDNTLIVGSKDAIIPNTVKIIDCAAFGGRKELTQITIPSGVTDIAGGAFLDCPNLESVTVDKGNTALRSEGNSIIRNSDNSLIFGCKTTVIPNSVKSIGPRSFEGSIGLTDITIPAGVKSIGELAFDQCSNLTSVYIPISVTHIGEGAFRRCSNLTIYAEAPEEPEEWEPGGCDGCFSWNQDGRPVIWGHKRKQ